MADTLNEAFEQYDNAVMLENITGEGIVNEKLSINPVTREINIPVNEALFGIYTDKDVERKYFTCPRYVGDYVDLSQCFIFINYVTASGNYGQYLCDDVTVVGENIEFTWLLSGNVFDSNNEESFVYFAVQAKSADSEGNLKNRFNTKKAIGQTYSTIESSEQIEEQYADVILQIVSRIETLEQGGTGGAISQEQIQEAVNNYFKENPVKEGATEEQSAQIQQNTNRIGDLSGLTTEAKGNIVSAVNELKSDIEGKEERGTAESKVSEHNTSIDAHGDIRTLIEGLANRLNALADSDDTTLDQMSEVVAYIKSNKLLIDAITTSKINVSDIIDNLTTNVSNKPLSAAQGVKLKALIDAIIVPTKLSELENDSGYAKTTDIPEKLPNPQKLTFAGAVTAEYDGSKPVSVEIPSGGGSTSGNSKYSLISEVVTEKLLNRIVIEIPSNINEIFAYVKVPASSDKNAIYATAWSDDIAMIGDVGEVGVDKLETNECYIKMHFLKLGNYRLCDYASKAYFPPISLKFYAGGKVGEITGNYYIFGVQYENIVIPVGTEIKLYGR